LKKIRKKKQFDPKEYLKFKTLALNNYLKKHNLNSVVIGISGGIDSAVSLGILKEANIPYIHPLCMPAPNTLSVSNQDSATKKGIQVIKHFNLTPKIIDLKPL